MTAIKNTIKIMATEKGNALFWWIATLVTYGLTSLTRIPLDASYAASRFPVPFYEGQTTFDAVELQGYYEFMVNAGTLDIYWQTQFIDFGFILANVLNLFCAGVACYRSLPKSWLENKFGQLVYASIWIMPLAPIFDAFENLASFVLLNQVGDLSQPMTVFYSSLASIKFALFVLSYLWVIGVVVSVLMHKLITLVKPKTKAA